MYIRKESFFQFALKSIPHIPQKYFANGMTLEVIRFLNLLSWFQGGLLMFYLLAQR